LKKCLFRQKGAFVSDMFVKKAGDEQLFVTFVLFAYNQEKYIREAVEGALSQTYGAMEIILSDDRSTDRTFEIMEEVVAEYTGIHEVILRKNTSNLGLINHINEVVKLCKGEWIVVAAGDDISDSNRVLEIVQTIKENPEITGISSELRRINPESADLDDIDLNMDHNKSVILWGENELIDGFYPLAHGATAAYSKKLFTDFAPLSENSIYEDAILSFRSVLIGKQAHINKKLVKYRSHDHQTTNISTDNIQENDIKRLRNYYGAYIVTLQYLDDYYEVFSSHSNDRIKAWIKEKSNFAKYRYKALSWMWPFSIVSYILLQFHMKNEIPLSRDTKAKILLPKLIYKILKGNMS
jgi:cellulose synthase/poly-beta-1,6-N-acetylglucosamine synthase-like glycosyltransferase